MTTDDIVLSVSIGVLSAVYVAGGYVVLSRLPWDRVWHYWQVRLEQTWTDDDWRMAKWCLDFVTVGAGLIVLAVQL